MLVRELRNEVSRLLAAKVRRGGPCSAQLLVSLVLLCPAVGLQGEEGRQARGQEERTLYCLRLLASLMRHCMMPCQLTAGGTKPRNVFSTLACSRWIRPVDLPG